MRGYLNGKANITTSQPFENNDNNITMSTCFSDDLENELSTNGGDVLICEEGTVFTEKAFSPWVKHIEDKIHGFLSTNSSRIKFGAYATLMLLYILYVGCCFNHRFGDEGSIVLLIVTIFLTWNVFLKILDIIGIYIGLPQFFHSFVKSKYGRRIRKGTKYLAYIASSVAIVTYLVVEVLPSDVTNCRSFIGMLSMIFLCYIFSARPSRVNWHPVFWSLTIQFALAYITLRNQFGRSVFEWLGDLVKAFLGFSENGSDFVIGKDFRNWGVAMSTSGAFIFTSAFISLMNYWGVIEFLVLKLGGFLGFCLETGPVESVVAAANIFLSLTEVPLMVRLYLPTVTKSELHTIMTCGFASISGGVLGLFTTLGAPAKHLLTAAVISAPSALAISKLMYPETERVCLQSQTNIRIVDKKEASCTSAFSDGAGMAIAMCVAIFSNILAYVSIVCLLDALVGWLGERAGVEGLTFIVLCSYVFFPLAYVMGVGVQDCLKVGELIGIKLFSTPFISYQQLGFLVENRKMLENYQALYNDTAWHWQGGDILLEASNMTLKGGVLNERAEVITTYALCGFSGVAAIGVCLGILVPMCPVRKKDIVNLIVRAYMSGNIASFATGAMAGVLFTSDGTS